MTITDLMIGDYIYSLIHKNGQIEKKPCRVVGIRNDGCFIQCDDSDVWYKSFTFEPIPISSEILEKNGFKAIYSDKSAYQFLKKITDKGNDCETRIIIDLTHPNSCLVYSKQVKTRFEGAIHYVHELQHTIKSCKIDKEIEM